MKRFFTLLFYFISTQIVFAGSGIYETYLSTSLNGGADSYYGTGGANPTFNGQNLGSTINPNSNTLVIKLQGLNAWADNSSVVLSARMYYRVYKQGSSAPSFTSVNLPSNGSSGNNSFWNQNSTPTNINLLASANTIGIYNVEIYFETTTNGTNAATTIFENNGGANFIATFETTVALSSDVINLNVLYKSNINLINWQTASEKNNAQFNVQRSSNNQAWQTIGSVKATNNPSGAQYNFTDEAPLSNINYYRLQMVDNEGKVTYSKVVSVSGNDAKKSLAVYPNPVKAELNVVADGQATGVSIFDMTGKTVLQFNDNRTKVNVQDLPNGVYFMRLLDKNNLLGEPVRFVKQ